MTDEFFFGLHSDHLNTKADEIARRHGADHINYTEPDGRKRGWFACDNRGEPFNSRIAELVMADIDAAGGFDSLRRKR